jgi:hypothetical protein
MKGVSAMFFEGRRAADGAWHIATITISTISSVRRRCGA